MNPNRINPDGAEQYSLYLHGLGMQDGVYSSLNYTEDEILAVSNMNASAPNNAAAVAERENEGRHGSQYGQAVIHHRQYNHTRPFGGNADGALVKTFSAAIPISGKRSPTTRYIPTAGFKSKLAGGTGIIARSTIAHHGGASGIDFGGYRGSAVTTPISFNEMYPGRSLENAPQVPICHSDITSNRTITFFTGMGDAINDHIAPMPSPDLPNRRSDSVSPQSDHSRSESARPDSFSPPPANHWQCQSVLLVQKQAGIINQVANTAKKLNGDQHMRHSKAAHPVSIIGTAIRQPSSAPPLPHGIACPAVHAVPSHAHATQPGSPHSMLINGGSAAQSLPEAFPFQARNDHPQTQSLPHMEKQRRRKENHNAVERRRRDLINNMISQLAMLVSASPGCTTTNLMEHHNNGCNLRMNKGEVLEMSVKKMVSLNQAIVDLAGQLSSLDPHNESLRRHYELISSAVTTAPDVSSSMAPMLE